MLYARFAAGLLLTAMLCVLQLALPVPATAGDGQLAGLAAPVSVLPRLTDKLAPQIKEMTPWQPVQARCPPGQLVFLTSACGCYGACCKCSPEQPYLDHCTCKCSATPPEDCRAGFSAARK